MAFFLKALGLSDSIPGFPFTPAANDPGRTVYTSPRMCWTLRPGTQSDDAQTRVSIFTCSVSAAATAGSSGDRELIKQLARNTMRRAKSLMIPGFLKCHGAVEHSDTIYIATEPCVALKDVLESLELRRHYCGEMEEEYAASVAYGLDTVGGALGALQSNRLVHGNVHCGSIFISAASGFWRLFGLEFISAVDEVAKGAPGCLFESARRAGMVVGYRCPPELGSSSGGDIGSGDPVVAVDAWGLGCLLFETVGVTAEEAMNGRLNSVARNLSAAELRNVCRQSLPKSLHQGCSHLTTPNPRMRTTVAAFVENCEFVKKSPFVQYMKALSGLLLMDRSQQMRLVESLAETVEKFPLRACLCFVLPRLGELARTAAKAGGSSGAIGVSIGPLADPVLKISERTAAGEDFDTHVTPVLVQLYQSADVLLRYKLLLGVEAYGAKLSSTALNNAIWPLYAKGFAYSAPSVREYSARALVHLAPHMSESILGDQVPKALAQLQRDVDGALRANATIALNLISEHITPPSQRAMVMLAYCCPMLRDSFEPSRVAALRSLHGSLECLSAKQIAESVLPVISPLTADQTSAESRTAALSLLKASMARLEAHHKQLSAQRVTTAAGGPVAANRSTDASSTSTPVPAAVPAGTASRGWSLLEGFTISSALSTAGAAPQRVDAVSAPVPSSASSPLRPTPVATVLPTPVVDAASSVGGGGSGWSDDDEAVAASEDDGKGRPHAFRESSQFAKSAAPPPSAPTAPFFAGTKSAPTAASYAASPVNAVGGAHESTSSLTGLASSPPSQPVLTVPNTSRVLSRPGISSLVGGTGGAARVGVSGSTDSVTASASSGPMKLRRKGGLGAARLD
ncbi:conserved hypothetical protein [Leishmania major strain Friedlin]|uniref:Protein kinase domain-containing protein n=1 Tax=Leishmania major TaxID=5664 RepID=Q4QCB6_LEIMA|nr:conserved hypothetical protein [Leishmania major strain Friedlin]CAG9573427.1 hypothetical_protein_-_conserved [Leishmania major strain Friedlin]CAJ04371.1 conserved hypothetical protein [Leishmania major strain Friedlin]|eukprot:XP_001683032.1 conserved hypothetical protein [Leishmania major strain Friedlin]